MTIDIDEVVATVRQLAPSWSAGKSQRNEKQELIAVGTFLLDKVYGGEMAEYRKRGVRKGFSLQDLAERLHRPTMALSRAIRAAFVVSAVQPGIVDGYTIVQLAKLGTLQDKTTVAAAVDQLATVTRNPSSEQLNVVIAFAENPSEVKRKLKQLAQQGSKLAKKDTAKLLRHIIAAGGVDLIEEMLEPPDAPDSPPDQGRFPLRIDPFDPDMPFVRLDASSLWDLIDRASDNKNEAAIRDALFEIAEEQIQWLSPRLNRVARCVSTVSTRWKESKKSGLPICTKTGKYHEWEPVPGDDKERCKVCGKEQPSMIMGIFGDGEPSDQE